VKPLGGKAYGSIPHLPESRLGPGDHHCSPGQAHIATRQARDRHDRVIVQEKLDGSCCAVARVGGEIVALGRAGYLARTSRFEQHQLFDVWVRRNIERFGWLGEGERLVGEWLAQAHGTRYELTHEPFVPFDWFRGLKRAPYDDFVSVTNDFVTPRLISNDGAPFSVEDALYALETSGHGATDPVEGAVWRVERNGEVDFLAKYVRPDKRDGLYLPEISGEPAVWQWRP
jgi:hypothetical protein